MLIIHDQLTITSDYLHFQCSRASGPGGQNVNKVNTQVHLIFELKPCPQLSEPVKHRLIRLAGHLYCDKGILIIRSDTTRSQYENKQTCLEKLRALILAALTPPKKRRPTRPTFASKERRLQAKSKRRHTKQLRGKIDD